MKKINPARIAYCGVLIAVTIVLSRFLSFNTWNLKIGFSFLPVALAGILFGPLAGGIVGALADFIGAILIPIGPYFPGFTATAFASGFVYGILLHRRRTLPRICAAALIDQLILGLVINTAWITMISTDGRSYFQIMGTRVLQCTMLTAVSILMIQLMKPLIYQLERRIH